MNIKIKKILELINGLMLSNLFMSTLLSLSQMDTDHKPEIVWTLWVPLYILGSYIIMRIFRHIVPHLIFHVALAAVLIPFWHNLSFNCFSVIALIALFIISISQRHEKRGFIVLALPVEMVLMYLPYIALAGHYGHRDIQTFIMAAGIIYMFLGLLAIYLSNLYDYLTKNADCSGATIKNIVGSSNATLGLFVCIILIAGIIMNFAPLDRLVDWTLNAIVIIIRYPVRFILFLFDLTGSSESLYMDMDVNSEQLSSINGHQPIIWKILEWCLKVFIFYIAVKVAIKGFISLVRYISGRNVTSEDEITYTPLKMKKDPKQTKKLKRAKVSRQESKIRKLFIKTVREHDYTLNHLHKSATAEDIKDLMVQEDMELLNKEGNYDRLIDDYEKVRYGRGGRNEI